MGKTAKIAAALAMVLAAAAAGCATAQGAGRAAAPATDPALNGAWVHENGSIYAFGDGNWEGLFAPGEPFLMGTFATEGGVISMTVTHIRGAALARMLEVNLEDAWLPIGEARAVFIGALDGYGVSAEYIEAQFNSFFAFPSVAYSVSGDVLTLGGLVYARM